MLLRRDRRGHRYLNWQIGLLFLGAGVLVGGMLTEDRRVTAAAILILVAAAILGMVGRRRGAGDAPDD